MSEENASGKEHYLKELKEMIDEGKDPKDKIFAVFCQRHGISINECKKYYNELVRDGKSKKK